MTNKTNILFQLDWLLVVLYLGLVVAGWFSIYATTAHGEILDYINFDTFYGKQSVWILLSLVIVVLLLSIEAQFYERFAAVFYVISILSLLGLFVFGNTIKGQTNWYSFGGFSLQPSEFVKFTTALALAKIMSDNLFDISKFSDLRKVLLVLFVPFLLIALQPDVGSAIIYTSFVFVLLREKMPFFLFLMLLFAVFLFIATIKFGAIYTLVFSFSVVLFFIFFAYRKSNMFLRKNWGPLLVLVAGILIMVIASDFTYKHVLKKHHTDRLALWLRLEKNPSKLRYLKRDYGYNNDQSVKAIATGGVFGKGFLEGDRTNGNFVPEQHTDYIFSAIGEEFGFVGSSVVVLLFAMLILRLVNRAEAQKSKFSRVYGYGVASIFFVHFVINIGMVTDLLPTVGIPLPFFSYGGSSLWGFTILLFVFIKLDSNQSNVL